jgi:endonuclease-3
MAATAEAKRRAAKVVQRLKAEYPDAECALLHDSPLELLIATILSAQCTDARVNIVTRDLFSKYRSAADFARAPIAQLEKAVQSTGFFRNKARNIKACCQQLVDEHGGKVPQDMDVLVNLPGIGRKTANVVLGTAFGLPTGVVVDTHVMRLSHRLGLTSHKDPVKIERDLMAVIPKSEWIDFSHRMIHHGRKICVARKPRCEQCVLNDVCPRIGVEGARHVMKPPPIRKTKRGSQTTSKI